MLNSYSEATQMARPRKHLPAGAIEIIRQAASHGVKEVDLARQLGMSWDCWARIRRDDQILTVLDR